MNGSANALLTILNDILDYSKIEAGKLDIDPVNFDLHRTIREATEMLALSAQQKGLELIVRSAPELPRSVVGDAGRIRQVLINLVSNAIKFTERGHVLVDIAADLQGKRQVELRFSVEDTGIGISEEQIRTIFDKFTQADASTTRKYGGTGLGLAISKRLVRLMGGRIGVRSESGKGSVFWFELKLPTLPDTRLPEPDLGKLKEVRVLVVDDHPVNRRVCSEYLTNGGIRHDCCSSGRDALEALKHAVDRGDPFHMAVIDYHMPDMDGIALAERIKAEEALKNTILVMLSSVGGKGESVRGMDAGFASYLLKPVSGPVLVNTLSEAWGERHRKAGRKHRKP